MTKFFSLLFVLFLLISAPLAAQDFSETLSEVGEAYARAYVDPLAESLGADMNSGLFHTASTGKKILGVNVYIGFKASATFLNASQKSFDLTYSGTVPIEVELAGDLITLDVPATFTVTDAPTIFGEEEEAMASVSVNHDTTFQSIGLTLPISIDSTLSPQQMIGGLLPTNVAPFLVPQVGIGTVMGTDIMVRFLPQITVPDYGSVEILGFGIRHNINQYVPLLPIDLAIQAVWQRVGVDDELDNQLSCPPKPSLSILQQANDLAHLRCTPAFKQSALIYAFNIRLTLMSLSLMIRKTLTLTSP